MLSKEEYAKKMESTSILTKAEYKRLLIHCTEKGFFCFEYHRRHPHPKTYQKSLSVATSQPRKTSSTANKITYIGLHPKSIAKQQKRRAGSKKAEKRKLHPETARENQA